MGFCRFFAISERFTLTHKMAQIEGFFEHYIICKMYHFQTVSGFRHTKIDEYISKFLLNFDRFMEVMQGQSGTIDNTKVIANATMRNDQTITTHLNDMIRYLNGLQVNAKALSPELANIRDEMIADIQQLKYLFTFN